MKSKLLSIILTFILFSFALPGYAGKKKPLVDVQKLQNGARIKSGSYSSTTSYDTDLTCTLAQRNAPKSLFRTYSKIYGPEISVTVTCYKRPKYTYDSKEKKNKLTGYEHTVNYWIYKQLNPNITYLYPEERTQGYYSLAQQTIKIHNNSGATALYLYVRPANTEIWSPNLIYIPIGQNVSAYVINYDKSFGTDGKYDFWLRDGFGQSFIKYDLEVTPDKTITITRLDRKPGYVKIVNMTGNLLDDVYMRPAKTNNWGRNLLELDLEASYDKITNQSISINKKSSFFVESPESENNMYDVSVLDAKRNVYTQKNVQINGNDPAIVLTKSDLVKKYITVQIKKTPKYSKIYVRPSNTDRWIDVLPRGTGKGKTLDISMEHFFSNGKNYDIWCGDYIKWNEAIMPDKAIEFTKSDGFRNSPVGFVTLFNRTGYRIFNVYVRPADTETWSENILARDGFNELLKGFPVKLPVSTQNKYFIKLVDENERTYIKEVIKAPYCSVEISANDMVTED